MKGFIEVTEDLGADEVPEGRKVLININSISSIDNRCLTIPLNTFYNRGCVRYLLNEARIFLTVERTVPTIEDSGYPRTSHLKESGKHTVNYITCHETIEEVKALIEQAQNE